LLVQRHLVRGLTLGAVKSRSSVLLNFRATSTGVTRSPHSFDIHNVGETGARRSTQMFGAYNPAFGPTAVRTMATALDEAWAIIEENGKAERHNPQEIRLALARRIIELAADGDYDMATLRDAALASLALPRA